VEVLKVQSVVLVVVEEAGTGKGQQVLVALVLQGREMLEDLVE
jgi:hypothetical protein